MKKLKKHINLLSVLIPLFMLLALLLKNPFSERNLIANFEPFPDTFHYITTPRCFLNGQGWNLCREGRTINPAVPPLYSITLLPFLALSKDPRIFYVANVFLSLLSLVLLSEVLKKLKINPKIIFLSLMLYTTNYYTYWTPSLAMAEILIMPIFLIGILSLLNKPTLKNSIISALVVLTLFETKYAAVPISIIFAVFYIHKILSARLKLKNKLKKSAQYFLLILIPLFLLEKDMLLNTVRSLLQSITPSTANSGSAVSTFPLSSWAFSKDFFLPNFNQYLGIFKSQPVRYLWESRPLFAQWIVILGLAGLLIGLIKKKQRKITLALVSLVMGQIIFLSFFYVVDIRYVNIVLPTVLIGIAIGLQATIKYLRAPREIITLVMIAVSLFHLNSILPEIKYQLALNLKYTETPWWYVASRNIDEFVKNAKSKNENIVVISAMPPYLIDYYATQEFTLLPLSKSHDFKNNKKELWGDYNYDDLPTLYAEFLNSGHTVYVASYGIGNVQERRDDFDLIKNSFDLQLLEENCHGLCNIYQIK